MFCMYLLLLYPYIKAIGQLVMKILYLNDLGDTECLVFELLYVVSYTSPLYQILKQLLMETLHFKDGGGGTMYCLAANAVVLVLRECQIAIATYLRGYLPSYDVVLQCIEN